MIVGRTFDNQNVSAKADGGLYQAILKDGILWGCGISYTASAISIESGQMIIGGRVIGIDGVTQVAADGIISEGFGRVVLTINSNNESTEELFTQVTLGMEYSTTNVFTALTQEAINNTGVLYQQELAVFTIAGGSITGISSTLAEVYAITNRGGEIGGDVTVDGEIIANDGLTIEHGQIKIPVGLHGLADESGSPLFYQIESGIQIGGTTAAGGGRSGETSVNSQGGLRVRNGGIISAGALTIANGGADINGETTISGSLILTKRTDAQPNESTRPALIIGGLPSQTHIEIDNNEIMAKANETEAADLVIPCRLRVSGNQLTVGNGIDVYDGGITVDGGANITGGLVLADNDIGTLKSPYWVSTDATGSPNAIFDSNGGLRRTSGSSRRFKRDIEDLPDEVASKVLKLRPVQFEFKLDEQGKKRIGFIAEETYEVAPEVADYETLEDGSIQCNNVRYGEITAALLKIVKKQQEEIEAIKEQLKG